MLEKYENNNYPIDITPEEVAARKKARQNDIEKIIGIWRELKKAANSLRSTKESTERYHNFLDSLFFKRSFKFPEKNVEIRGLTDLELKYMNRVVVFGKSKPSEETTSNEVRFPENDYTGLTDDEIMAVADESGCNSVGGGKEAYYRLTEDPFANPKIDLEEKSERGRAK
ncbi:MAG: hypothetical protein WDA21_03010 [Bacilli bacterium]